MQVFELKGLVSYGYYESSVCCGVRDGCVRRVCVPCASPFIGSRRRTGVTMDKGEQLDCAVVRPSRSETVWPSLRPRRPPTPDDVAMASVVSSQCRMHCPVVLPGAVPVVAVIRGWPLSRRGLVIRVATVATCASFPVRH